MSCGCNKKKPHKGYVDFCETLNDPCNVTYCSPCPESDCITPMQGCAGAKDCEPIPVVPLMTREYRLCVDQNGCATRYPADCRNRFWPNFSHPRWLPCGCLYCTGSCCQKGGTNGLR